MNGRDDDLSISAALELTHNWGTESDESFQAHSGNTEPKGYGHIGLSGEFAPVSQPA